MRILFLFITTALLPSTAAPQEARPPVASENPAAPFLAKHCRECHSGEKPKGNFRVDQLDPTFAGKSSEERWHTVLDQIRSGDMPPKKKTRPPEDEKRAVTEWLARKLAASESARRAGQGRVVLRRLNRVEYTNTIRDLLDVEVDLREMLALDGSTDGFDNVGSGLHLSSFALDRYMEAADRALDVAIAGRPAPATSQKRHSLKNSHRVRNPGQAAFRVLDDDTVVCFLSVPWQSLSLDPFYPQDRGHYRIRICASGFQSSEKPVTFSVTNQTTGLVGYFDAPADTPTIFEFVIRAEARSGVSLLPYGLAGKIEGDAETFGGPGLAIHWFEIEGPLYDAWPPASHRRIFGDLPQVPSGKWKDRREVVSTNPLADAERILRAFVPRAFRCSVTEEEVQPFVSMVRGRLEEKDSFEQAVRAGLSAVLMSRRFLFLAEKAGPLDDFALASRLSYFLWSSMPDEELLRLAGEKTLGRPETLRAQVERMLASPKAAAFTTNFCGQWLGLRDIDFTAPNHIAYPEFDELLKVSMVREAELFFTAVLKNDLSLLNFVASDFSMLNGRLARHYGIPGIEGLWEFRKVPLPPESHRGGFLTMAAVLKVTANGTSTSPVTRGAWVLDRILGTPPPKPPPGVSALEPDIRGATTIREQLAKHRTIATCASCHAQIDPPGFALESFDVIGGWRDYYRLTNWVKGAKEVKGKHYLQGPNVDPTGELSDGRRFQNIDELKQMLLRDKDQIARGLAGKLVTYATGGAPEPADHVEIEAIVARVREKNYGLKTLAHEIVQSHMFRDK